MNRTIPSLSWKTRILVCTIPSGTESEILRSSIFKSGLSASMTFFTSSQCLLRSSGHKAFCVGLVGALIMPRWPKQNEHDLREETVRTHEVVWWTYFAIYQPMPTHAADSYPSPDAIPLHITPRLTGRRAQPPEGAKCGWLLLHADALPRQRSATDCRSSSYSDPQHSPRCTNSSGVEPFSRLKQPTRRPHAARPSATHKSCALCVYGMLITEKRYRSTKKERGREAV